MFEPRGEWNNLLKSAGKLLESSGECSFMRCKRVVAARRI